MPNLAAVRDGDVVDALVGLACGVEPALDDLDAIEVAAVGVSQRSNEKGGCLAQLVALIYS